MRKLFKSQLFMAVAAALLSLAFEATQVFDHVYWNLWYKVHSRQASQDAMIVSLDGGRPASPSLPSASTQAQAELVNRLVDYGARHIYFDLPYVAGTDSTGDQALGLAIGRAGDRITLVNRAKTNRRTGHGDLIDTDFAVPSGTGIAASTWNVNVFGFAQSSPLSANWQGKSVSAVAARKLSGGQRGALVYPDFAIDPGSVPIKDAVRVLDGRVARGAFWGKDVFVTSTSPAINSSIGYFGHGWVPSAMLDISSDSAVMRQPLMIGGLPLLVLFCSLMIVGTGIRLRRGKVLFYSGGAVLLIVSPLVLMEGRIFSDVGAAAVAGLVYCPVRLWTKWRQRVQLTSSDSGLPNIDALAARDVRPNEDVISASIAQYEQILASLPKEHHGECARQIARRLSLASRDAEIYDSGNGHFVWKSEAYGDEALIAHLEGLKALLSAPVLVAGNVLDTNVHFGIDRNYGSAAISRVKAAIASSTEAAAKGILFEEFGQQRIAQASWDLSLHARIDEGLKNGDIWLAFQPQLDLHSGQIVGAEALIRWNDPVRGPIPPDAFILQAEKAGRIDAITYWVIEQAIVASRRLEAKGLQLSISVNLSARMADQPTLVPRICDIVNSSGFDCRLMIFEVTETFGMADHDIARQNLAALRAMGFRVSIDDFGTGQGGLAYLSQIPCDEIKIDKRFVQAIETNPRDKAIVASSIHLAHALEQTVVAEGVEETATLNALRAMGCDLAQGYLIARPMAFDAFAESLVEGRDMPRKYG